MVSWKSKKQPHISKSSTDSEYRVVSTACFEIIWFRRLLVELGFSQHDSTPLYVENTSVIQIVANSVFYKCNKHIEVHCHSIRETYDDNVISLSYVTTQLQVADAFIKVVPLPRHQFLSC